MWGMSLSLSSQDYQQMLLWASRAHPQECCGIIFGHENRENHYIVDEIRLTKNVALDQLSNFEIDPRALIDAHKLCRNFDLRILGYFHSHPNGLAQPSKRDADMTEIDEKIWIIIAQNDISAWQCRYDGVVHEKFKRLILHIDNISVTY